MNKTKTAKFARRSPLRAVITAILARLICLVACAAAAFLCDDPASLIPSMTFCAKISGELISGFIIARSVGKGFNRLTRVTLSVLFSLAVNTAELFIGKAISGGTPTGIILMPIAVLSCAIGAMLASAGGKSRKKRKRR